MGSWRLLVTGQALERSNGNGDYSLQSLERRIRLNRESGWGLEKGTGAQLNLLALFCQKHHLLPGDDVTLYDAKPWITVDGRVKLMRRHPAYISHRQRPLSADDKLSWGYERDDLVVVTTVKLLSHGLVEEIEAHGRVSAAELSGKPVFEKQRLNPLARRGVQPVEMAMKRSLARAERFAFGTESLVDDEELEEAARTVIEERNDPERVQRNSDRYQEIYGESEERAVSNSPRSAHAARVTPVESSVPPPASDLTDETEDEAKRRMEWEAEEIKRQRAQEGLL
jgi:hypothetical protein